MFRKISIAVALSVTFFTGSLAAGTALIPYWDGSTSTVISHLGSGTSADCAITYYNEAGSVVTTANHTFTAQYQSYNFASPSGTGYFGHAVITCDEQAIAQGYAISSSSGLAFSIPIYAGLPF